MNIIIFVFGLIIGSFLNCVVYRIENKQSFLKGHSYCPFCHHDLAWQDLIPVLSFLFLKGRCRYCRAKISWQYPLIEIFTGSIFLLIIKSQIPVSGLYDIINVIFLLVISSFFIIIFAYDLKHFIIPDKILIPAVLAVFLYRISFTDLDMFLNSIYSGLGASAFFLIIFLLSKGRWIGFGDVKLAFLMGVFLGFPEILTALFFAFAIGAIIGIGLILLKLKDLKSEVPFGPFLILGLFISFFWAENIINWYLGLLV
ncbi:MAG: prepilin peptidase [Candidatus Pacebacteria bacterium]|nr:prepilin peptidase [Candidatus Paceibacterota bacterium]